MHDVHGVAVSNASRDAPHYIPCFGLRHDPAGVDVVEEITILGHLEHKVDLSRSLYQSIHSQDVLVLESLNSVQLSR